MKPTTTNKFWIGAFWSALILATVVTLLAFAATVTRPATAQTIPTRPAQTIPTRTPYPLPPTATPLPERGACDVIRHDRPPERPTTAGAPYCAFLPVAARSGLE